MKLKLFAALCVLVAQPIYGTVIYSETIDGELSGLIDTPTSIGALGLGDNTVTGTISTGGLSFVDSFTFTVVSGQVLDSITFTLTTTDENHFFAFADDSTLVALPSELLIATLIEADQSGENILDTQSAGGNQGGTGLPASLGAGDYSIWFQETTPTSVIGYSFTLTTVTVPEPSTTTFLLLPCSVLFLRRRKHK